MSKHYKYIDALRGIAILGVIMLHVSSLTVHPVTGILSKFTTEGQIGVQLFYIVSALTLFLSLQSSHYMGKVSETVKYFLRRFFRIAPLFYLLLIGIFFFTFIKPLGFFSYVDKNILNFILSFTFTNSFFPVYINNIITGQWSIAVEMLFYIFVPIFFLKIKSLSDAKKYFLYSIILAFIIETTSLMIFSHATDDSWKGFLLYSLPIQLPVFMLGFVSFFLVYNADGKISNTDHTSIIKTIAYIFSIAFITEALFLIIEFIFLHKIDRSIIDLRIYIKSIVLLCLVVYLAKGYLSVLNNALFRFLGKISYSLYLTHFMTLMLIARSSIYISSVKHMNMYSEYIFLLIITVTISSIISYITYTLIERPGQTFGKYISKKLQEKNLKQI